MYFLYVTVRPLKTAQLIFSWLLNTLQIKEASRQDEFMKMYLNLETKFSYLNNKSLLGQDNKH